MNGNDHTKTKRAWSTIATAWLQRLTHDLFDADPQSKDESESCSRPSPGKSQVSGACHELGIGQARFF
jgi:hypothetical protein